MFDLSLHLHPYFGYASSEGSRESAHIDSPEPSLLSEAISTKILCACSYDLINTEINQFLVYRCPKHK